MLFIQKTPLQTEKTLSLIELIKDGGLGGQLIIGLLFLLLIIVIYIYFERLFAIKSASKISPNFMAQIKTYVLNHKIDGAQALCLSENKPVARLIAKGLSRIGRPLEDIKDSVVRTNHILDHQE
jgi:biopolymer transport protein ExbB